MTDATDWDAYYKNASSVTSITRTITIRKLIKSLKPFLEPSGTICELGGANSCVMTALCGAFKFSQYHIVDSNAYGLSLLPKSIAQTPVTHQLQDILVDDNHSGQYDLVLSIGLIEHFDTQGTFKAIQSHIDLCKPNGLILITFPTPTPPYRTIRKVAEITGKWQFHDERPLEFPEVLAGLAGSGEVLHQSINWLIGLTQGFILARKHSRPQ